MNDTPEHETDAKMSSQSFQQGSHSVSRLELLPLEIIEACLDLLEIQQICALRSTCRQLSRQCFGTRFKACLKHKSIFMTDSADLNRLQQFTGQGAIAESLECLTLIGQATLPSPSQVGGASTDITQTIDDEEVDTVALVSALRQPRCLQELSLQMSIRDQSSMPVRNNKSNYTLISRLGSKWSQQVFEAISQSRQSFPITRISLFAEDHDTVCSLSLDRFSIITEYTGIFSTLRKLSLCTSISQSALDSEDPRPFVTRRSVKTTDDLQRCLSACVVLEELHLRWFKTDLTRHLLGLSRLLGVITPASSLRRFHLEGLALRSDSLIEFLGRLSLESLKLEWVVFQDTELNTLFEFLARDSTIQLLCCNEVYMRGKLVGFEAADGNFRSLDGRYDNLSTTMVWHGDEIRRSIKPYALPLRHLEDKDEMQEFWMKRNLRCRSC